MANYLLTQTGEEVQGILNQAPETEAGLQQEVTNREQADTAMQQAVTAEVTARADADTALDGKIDAETTRAVAAEGTLTDAINKEVTDRTEAVTAEVTARADADTALDGKIDAETSRAEAAEGTLTDAINKEVTDRTAAVAAEATARQQADTTLQQAISTEAQARSAADTEILGNLQTESRTRLNADTDLQDHIDDEETRAKAAETTLQSNIDAVGQTGGAAVAAERERAQAAESTLDTKIEAETDRAEAAEGTLNAAIAQEVTDRTAAVSAEATARQQADTALQTAINGKQDTIADLADIRSGAAAGATAYQKPATGIPATDMSAGVQTSLDKADTALQEHQSLADYYTKSEVDSLITTPDQEYVSVTATAQTTAVTDLLPATGDADTIYRVGNWDGTQYDTTMYALFAWNGTTYVCLAVRSFVGEVYDVSVNHPDGQGNPTPYADLTAALGTDGANIPADIRRGGMSIKFIQGNAQSSDNKYVQFRLMSDSFNTTPTNWQGVDDKPTVGSDNLVKSGGVFNLLIKLADINWTQSGIEVGEVYYNNNNKQIRKKTGASTYDILPFVDGAIYTYQNELYIWNGSDLVKKTLEADQTPTAGSDNPVKSGGVMSALSSNTLYNIAGYIVADNGQLSPDGDTFLATDFIKIDKTVPIIVDNIGSSAAAGIAFYDKDFNFIPNSAQKSQTSYKVEVANIPSGAEYIRSSTTASSINENTVILGASILGLENEIAKTNKRAKQLEYNTAGSDIHIFGVNPVINFEDDNLTAVTPATSYANTSIRDKKKGSSNYYKTDVYALSAGNQYYLSGRLAGYNTQAVIFEDIALNTPLYVLSSGNNSEAGYTDIAFKITSDKTLYLGVTNDSSDTVKLSTIDNIKNVDANNVNTSDVILNGVPLSSILPQKEDTIAASSTITGYPQTAQRKVAGSLWQSNIYNVSNCQTVKITLSHYTSAYGIAFSTSATDTESFNAHISSKEDWFVNCTSTQMEIPVPIGAVYMAVAQDLSPVVVGKGIVPIENNIFGPLRGKTCLFIGDSISTQNNFKWKGLLESYHNLNYVRDISGQLAPANGGIPLMPYQTEPASDEQKTIWYRCAEDRMSIYTFDAVSIFGGTNDMLNPNIKVGDVTIASDGEFIDLDTILPYVDDASSFANPSLYTDEWSTDLTFTQCLMGCVEMIHRDFPTATIIIPTVMPCSDNYGGSKYTTIETSPVYGMRLSERLAIAAMRVANYYKARKPERVGNVDIIGVPLYWGVRTAESYAAFTNWLPSVGTPDGVHPNIDCAKRMVGMFAEMLFI